jgi:hypothetical protein
MPKDLSEFTDEELERELERREAIKSKPTQLPYPDWSIVKSSAQSYIDEKMKYPSLDSFAIGTKIRARIEYWGNDIIPNVDEDVIFEIRGFAPSKVYPRDGVILRQISGPDNEILAEKEDNLDDEYEPNASPIYAVARSEEEAEDYYVAFVVVGE